MKTTKIVTGVDVYLRGVTEADATVSYLDWLTNPLVNRYLESRFNSGFSISSLRQFITRCEIQPETLLLGIFKNHTDRHIGNIKIGAINSNHQTAELGFLIGETSEWGKGYATQAIILASDFAFLELGLAKLTAGAYAENISSQRALRKAGFIQEGVLRAQWTVAGIRQDGVIFGKHKNDDLER